MREGDTPLIDAARHGRAADVVALLAGGADVNERKSTGLCSTPLIIACQMGQGGESVLIKMMNLVAIGDDM